MMLLVEPAAVPRSARRVTAVLALLLSWLRFEDVNDRYRLGQRLDKHRLDKKQSGCP